MARPVRIVVGEGRTAQRGLLRFVLEGEGFEVVGEANGTADLPAALESQHPDVVVLDDGIGVMAVSMVHEVAPQAKVVLVWPAAVVPIGGDARVEPAKILRDLGPAVTHVVAASVALTESFERPDWIDKVRKDPATLRRKLLMGGAVAKRPSVTRLQRRGKRLHPRKGEDADVERERDAVPTPVVVLPVAAAGAAAEPIIDLAGPGADPVTTDVETLDERSEWNRRLGTLALSGAAAVSALVLALALGGGRVPISGLRGGGTLPPGVPGFVQGVTTAGVAGPFGFGTLGGNGYDPIASSRDDDEDANAGAGGPQGDAGDGFDGDALSPDFAGGSDADAPPDDPGDVDPGNGGNGGGGGGDGGGGGGGGDDDGGGAPPATSMPGNSAEHNPHGGPPSKLGLTPAHGPGLGNGPKSSPPGHVHKG
jgi:CheY-like chemotaxis protein